MNAGHHRVRAQALELRLFREEGAYALQESVRRQLLEKGLPAMDAVLSAFDGNDELIFIERLELNLGSLSRSQLESELVERLCGQLREALAEEVPKARESVSAARRVLRPAESGLEALRHFLRTGQFPWWAQPSWRKDPEGLLADVITESPAALPAMLRESASPVAVKRLARQFSAAALQRIAALLAGHRGEAALACVADWISLLAGSGGILPATENPAVFVYEEAVNCLLASAGATAADISQLLIADLSARLSLGPGSVAQRLSAGARETLPPASALRQWLLELCPYGEPGGFPVRGGQDPLEVRPAGNPADHLRLGPGPPRRDHEDQPRAPGTAQIHPSAKAYTGGRGQDQLSPAKPAAPDTAKSIGPPGPTPTAARSGSNQPSLPPVASLSDAPATAFDRNPGQALLTPAQPAARDTEASAGQPRPKPGMIQTRFDGADRQAGASRPHGLPESTGGARAAAPLAPLEPGGSPAEATTGRPSLAQGAALGGPGQPTPPAEPSRPHGLPESTGDMKAEAAATAFSEAACLSAELGQRDQRTGFPTPEIQPGPPARQDGVLEPPTAPPSAAEPSFRSSPEQPVPADAEQTTRAEEPGGQGPLPQDPSRSGFAQNGPVARGKPAYPAGRASQFESLGFGESEPAYLENAGLVLLWPFLPRYFQATGVVQDRRFVSLASQERAILLLHFLTHGSAEAAEPLLTLNKLLCGWPLAEPIAKAIEISATEESESAALLAAATAHWKALKGTSPDGFRRAFLRREGRLSHQENGWRLLLTRVAYDVLLDSLPWAIALVMLPWMAEPLAVEW